MVVQPLFKNRNNMFSISYSQKDYGIKITLVFFATSHGKGAVDGVGTIACPHFLLNKLSHETENILYFI